MSRTVVHLARLFTPHIGGVEKHVAELIKEHRKRGDSVVVITEQYMPALPPFETSDGLEIYRIPKTRLGSKIELWKWMWQRRPLFKNADIIHAHDVSWWLLPLFPLIFKKTFTTFHGWETKFPIPIKNKLQRFFYAALSKKTIHVGDWIREFYWDKPSAVTYGGFTSTKNNSEPLFPEGNELQITFLGRLEPDNAVPEYLKLLEELKAKLPNKNIKVTWIGDGSMHWHCQKWGEVTGLTAETTKHLKKANLVFAASYLSIIEAQSLGKIVVALHDLPLKKRYLKTYPGAGQMIAAGSPEAAAKQVLSVLKNKTLFNKMSLGAAEFAGRQTWEKVFQTYEKIWQ